MIFSYDMIRAILFCRIDFLTLHISSVYLGDILEQFISSIIHISFVLYCLPFLCLSTIMYHFVQTYFISGLFLDLNYLVCKYDRNFHV